MSSALLAPQWHRIRRGHDHPDHEHASTDAPRMPQIAAAETMTSRNQLRGRDRPRATTSHGSEVPRPEERHHGRSNYMKQHLLRSIGIGAAVAAFGAVPGQAVAQGATSTTATSGTAATSVDTSTWANPLLTQPFLAWGDSNWYALAPGETADAFGGAGWGLTGGAKVATTTLKDGTTGSVLDLPRGSTAVSPKVCL